MLRYQPLNRVRRRVTLLRYKRCCFSNVNYSQIMLARYWSLSRQNHLQLHSKSKAWQLSKQLKNGLLTKHKIKCTCRSYNQRMQFIINPGWWDATKESFFRLFVFLSSSKWYKYDHPKDICMRFAWSELFPPVTNNRNTENTK